MTEYEIVSLVCQGFGFGSIFFAFVFWWIFGR